MTALPNDLLDQAAECFAQALVDVTVLNQVGWSENYGDVRLIVTGAPAPALNGLLCAQPDPDPEQVQAAAARVARVGLPWSMQFRFRPSAEILALAAWHGLAAYVRPVFMTGEMSRLMRAAGEPSPAVIERVGASRWREYTAVLTAGFELPEGSFGSLMAGDVLGRESPRGFLARTPEGLAGTGFGSLNGDVLSLFNIAVLPSARRQGLGRALSQAVLADGAARGARTACLQSSPMARPLYESLGFSVTERWHRLH